MGFKRLDDLGQGPFGTAWRARIDGSRTVIALKPLPSGCVDDPARRAGLWAAVIIAGRVASPHVARTMDVVRLPEGPHLAREYVSGTSVAELLRSSGPVDWLIGRKLVRDMALGLAAIHGAGLLHLDLKPANVVVDDRGAAHLTDYGLAAILREMVDPAWTAPEGALDARSDIYSLGLVACELMGGTSAAAGTPHLDRLPEGARPLVAWLLAPNPLERPSSALQVVAAIEASIAGRGRVPALVAPALLPMPPAIVPPPPAIVPPPPAIVPPPPAVQTAPPAVSPPTPWTRPGLSGYPAPPPLVGGGPPSALRIIGAAALVATVLAAPPMTFWLLRSSHTASPPTHATSVPSLPPTATSRPVTPTPSPTAQPSGAPSFHVVDPTQTLPPSAVSAFLARIKKADFQFQATISGTVTDAITPRHAVSGTASMKGFDSALQLEGQEGDIILGATAYSVILGDTHYFEGGGTCGTDPICAGYRESDKADSYLAWFRSIPELTDLGLVSWRGADVHALWARDVDPGQGLLILSGLGLDYDVDATINFMVGSDGTPLGMVLDLTWRINGRRDRCELVLDYRFDRLSGVTITAPPA